MRNPPEQQSQQLSEIERDMLGIMSQLSQCDNIALISELTITPTVHTLLGRGEVGVTATAEVVVIF